MSVVNSCLQEKLAEFDARLAELRAERLQKRKLERKQKRKAEALAAQRAEEEQLGECSFLPFIHWGERGGGG